MLKIKTKHKKRFIKLFTQLENLMKEIREYCPTAVYNFDDYTQINLVSELLYGNEYNEIDDDGLCALPLNIEASYNLETSTIFQLSPTAN